MWRWGNERGQYMDMISEGKRVVALLLGVQPWFSRQIPTPRTIFDGALITGAPKLFLYVQKKAAAGDPEAQALLNGVMTFRLATTPETNKGWDAIREPFYPELERSYREEHDRVDLELLQRFSSERQAEPAAK